MSANKGKKSVNVFPAIVSLLAAAVVVYFFYDPPEGDEAPGDSVGFSFEEGWYNQEQDGKRVWRWADDRATIRMEADGKGETRIFKAMIRGAFDQTVKLVFNGEEVRRLPLAADRFVALRLALPMKSGGNVLEFVSDGEAVTRGADERELAFVLENFEWKAVESAEDTVVVDFGSGWYPRERANERSWSWSSGEGQLDLENFGVGGTSVVLSFEMSSVEPRVVKVFQGEALVSTVTFDEVMSQIVEVPLSVGVGESRIRFLSTTPASNVEGDSRDLAYCVFDPVLKAPEQEE